MDHQARFILKALQGKTVTVTDESVKITKEGGFFAAQREKTIPLRQITSVEVKAPSKFVGFIQFSIAGGRVNNSSFTLSGGAFDAAGDENAATFTSADCYATAQQIKEFLEQRLSQRDVPAAPVETPADALVKYAELVDKGLMTKPEFEQIKKRLLGL